MKIIVYLIIWQLVSTILRRHRRQFYSKQKKNTNHRNVHQMFNRAGKQTKIEKSKNKSKNEIRRLKNKRLKKKQYMNNHLERPYIMHGDNLDDQKNSVLKLLQDYQSSDHKYELSVVIENNNMKIQKGMGNNRCVMARFKNQINQIGWDTLVVESDMQMCDKDKDKYKQDLYGYYAMGYLEGLLTYKQIGYFWNTYYVKHHFQFDKSYELLSQQEIGQNSLYQNVLKDMKSIYNKMQKVINEMSSQKYKQQLIKQDYQYNGMLDGFNRVASEQIKKGEKAFTMSNEMFMLINYDGAVDDLKSYSRGSSTILRRMNNKLAMRFKKLPRYQQDFISRLEKQLSLRCNVLFKITKTNDIMMSHSTMDSYYAMERVFKYLQIKRADKTIKKITYSSYPGCLSSTDDFFMIDGNLMVTETTLSGELTSDQVQNAFHGDSYKYIPEFMKVMASNHLARSGYDWTQKMNVLKGAVYYSQWLVFDLQKFEQNMKQIQDNGNKNVESDEQNGFLYLLEDEYSEKQIQAVKIDERLKSDGYFASVNSAYNPNEDVSQSFGRQQVFYQKQKFAQNIKGIQKVMAYSEQKSDADYLSSSDSTKKQIEQEYDNSIAIEIRPINFGDMLQGGLAGVIDIKVTDSTNLKQNKCFTRGGPSKDQNKQGFEWPKDDVPIGQPNKWDFDFVEMGPNDGSM